MKYTLLDMVQSILNVTDGDEVNSISDTVEAEQIALILRDTYFEMLSTLEAVPEHKKLGQLTGLGDVDHPNYMQLPDGTYDVSYIRYNKIKSGDSDDAWGEVYYKAPEEFLRLVQARPSSKTDDYQTVTDLSGNSVKLYISKKNSPEYWTTFDDNHVVFDAYDVDVDTTLQQSKSAVLYAQTPNWVQSNSFVPDLDDNLFPMLLSTAKNTYYALSKQTENPVLAKNARNQKTDIQNAKHRMAGLNTFNRVNYGRR